MISIRVSSLSSNKNTPATQVSMGVGWASVTSCDTCRWKSGASVVATGSSVASGSMKKCVGFSVRGQARHRCRAVQSDGELRRGVTDVRSANEDTASVMSNVAPPGPTWTSIVLGSNPRALR